jgi:17beta-estradiol 17-dehydrogenase/3beta-hydroxysteroid 3-dehydrogenase
MRVALVTGANGAVGMGIISRMLDDNQFDDVQFVLTCRSVKRGEKALESILASRKEQINDPSARFHIVACDLASPSSVRDASKKIRQLVDRVDFLFLNAGVMPTEKLDLFTGLGNLVTRPSYVARTGGDFMKQQEGLLTDDGLGYVFVCNVFGHYILVNELIPLLQVANGNGRILWCSSTTAAPELFDPSDWQSKKGKHPYESSKRLLELVSMYMYADWAQKYQIYSLIISPGNVISNISTSQASAIIVTITLYIVSLLLFLMHSCDFLVVPD